MKTIIIFSLISSILMGISACNLEEPIDLHPIKFSKTLDISSKDIGTRIYKTLDENFVVCGISKDSTAMWAAKLNQMGDTLWQMTYDELGKGEARDIIETKDGSLMICGSVFKGDLRKYDIVVVKINTSDGQLSQVQAPRFYGGENNDLGFSIKQTADSGFIVAGLNSSKSGKFRVGTVHLGDYDMYLLKLNAKLEVEWDNQFGGLNYDAAHSVIQLPDQSYVLCGSKNQNGNNDLYIVKTNISGVLVKDTPYGDIGDEVANAIKLTRDGGFIVSGYTTSVKEGSNGGRDVYILKIKNDLSIDWKYPYGGVSDEESYDIIQTADDGFAAIGYQQNINGVDLPEPYLVKITKDGKEIFKKKVGKPLYGRGASLVETSDCGLMIFGTSFNKNLSKDFLIIKTDKNGIYE
jgi:hypothetical protein